MKSARVSTLSFGRMAGSYPCQSKASISQYYSRLVGVHCPYGGFLARVRSETPGGGSGRVPTGWRRPPIRLPLPARWPLPAARNRRTPNPAKTRRGCGVRSPYRWLALRRLRDRSSEVPHLRRSTPAVRSSCRAPRQFRSLRKRVRSATSISRLQSSRRMLAAMAVFIGFLSMLSATPHASMLFVLGGAANIRATSVS